MAKAKVLKETYETTIIYWNFQRIGSANQNLLWVGGGGWEEGIVMDIFWNHNAFSKPWFCFFVHFKITTYMEGSAPLSKRYFTHLSPLFFVDLLIAK